MVRIRSNFVSGVIDNNPLAIGGLTLNATELADLAVVASPDIAAIILDPTGGAGDPEIVHVTAHSGSATTATIVRAREGTVAREHLLSVSWVHGPTQKDFPLKELTIPFLSKNDTSINAYTALNNTAMIIEDVGKIYTNFIMPSDFLVLESAVIVFKPNDTETVQWDIICTFGAIGEDWENDTNTISNDSLAVTIDRWTELDVIAALSGIVANDIVGFSFQADTNAMYLHSLRIKYN